MDCKENHFPKPQTRMQPAETNVKETPLLSQVCANYITTTSVAKKGANKTPFANLNNVRQILRDWNELSKEGRPGSIFRDPKKPRENMVRVDRGEPR